MATQPRVSGRLRFDGFELDVRAGELRKHGVRLRLRGQPLQVLEILLESRRRRCDSARNFRPESGRQTPLSILTTACTTQLRAFAKCLAIRRRNRATSKRFRAGDTGTSVR